MKRAIRGMPIPQWEFGFTPQTFNLIVETGVDGDRLIRECEQAEEARQIAEAAQPALFQNAE